MVDGLKRTWRKAGNGPSDEDAAFSPSLHVTSDFLNEVKSTRDVCELGQEASATDCPAIDGLIREANESAGEVNHNKVLDAAVIGSAQAIEHYEISRYGTLISCAETLGHDDLKSLLDANLREEKAADRKLNMLAEGAVNRRARGERTAAHTAPVKRRTGTPRKA
jgi:ferritin-like metal-binding protein YciE